MNLWDPCPKSSHAIRSQNLFVVGMLSALKPTPPIVSQNPKDPKPNNHPNIHIINMTNNTMKITPASRLVLKYLALPNSIGGRGGAQRYFLLSQEIPFSEQLFALGDEWATEKKRIVETGENPSSTVPVIVAENEDDRVYLPQHIATARLLARVHGKTSGDDYQDYVQDMVADEYQGFRNKWVYASFEASDEEKATYQTTEIPQQLTKFNALYQHFKTHDIFLSVNPANQNPLWGDAALFGLLRDNILTGHIAEDDLKAYPELMAMYQAYGKIPAVAAWIEKALAK
jgi:glutathione S-transferase